MLNRPWPSVFAGLVLSLPLLLAACPSPETVRRDASSGPTDQPLVLTTFTVLADMARNVAGDRLRVESPHRVLKSMATNQRQATSSVPQARI
jgi:manganese transport system substrate-binding protein